MANNPQGLRILMQDNMNLLRLEEQVLSKGVDVKRDMSSAYDGAGIAPRPVVAELASTFSGPQGTVLHIPVEITGSTGGRRSLFEITTGQETVAGFYVVKSTIFQRRVTKREGGDDLRVGDLFTERITDMVGDTAQVHSYKVAALGSKTAAMYLRSTKAEDDLDTGDIVNAGDGWCWFCNMASQWWCGFPCLPDIPDDLDDIIFV